MKIVLLLVCSTIILHAQGNKYKTHPYSENLVITALGGVTIGITDFEKSKPGFSGGGMIEYFIPAHNQSIFGIRLHFTGNTVIGKETADNPGFKTDLYSVGTGFTYLYSVDDIFFPYAFAGISFINFFPTVNGQAAPNRYDAKYSSNSFAYNTELGSRFAISPDVSLNISFAYNFPQNDNLDDITYSDNFDKYYTISAGISFALLGESDADKDGILDKNDPCINEAEDLDGFEDEDGCPDYDNDKDGIMDVSDQCINNAEDIDGFNDTDGCPEPDNDNDGIYDNADKCANHPEDFDGIEDEDGCPDLDNDQDGILDSSDKCPTSAEDIDGFEDSDGCPEFDNDKDGISDKDDKCPNTNETFNGFEDTDGCPDLAPPSNDTQKEASKRRRDTDTTSRRSQLTIPPVKVQTTKTATSSVPNKIVLEEFSTFEDDKAKLKSQSYNELDKIAEIMKKNPDAKWRIEGYTDKQSEKRYASNLGGKRANEVMLYLVKKGVPLKQLEVVDMGERNPRSDNDKPSGRALNRRVEIKKSR